MLLVDYLTVLDAHSRSAVVDFAADELDACRALQSALVEGYAVAARHSGADLVPVSSLSRGHGLGSAEPWVSDFIPEVRRTVGSFHPNAVGNFLCGFGLRAGQQQRELVAAVAGNVIAGAQAAF